MNEPDPADAENAPAAPKSPMLAEVRYSLPDLLAEIQAE